MAASGHFFHARQSSELIPENLVLKPSNHRRQRSALSERSASELNSYNGAHPTIRLVDPDSSSPMAVYEKTPFPRLPSQVLKPTKTTRHGYTVQNDTGFSNLDARLRDRSASPKRTSKLFPQSLTLNKANRMSAATTISNSDTLFNDSLYSPTSNRFSTDGTLRNTPTPQEMEERALERARAEALDALEEEDPSGPSTIRPVTASSGSTERALSSRGSDMLSQHPALRQINTTPPRNLARLSSIESVGTPASAGPGGSSPNVNIEVPSSEYSSQHSSSSPNQRPSEYNIIRYATSDDDMSVQYASVRPPSAMSQSAESTWSTGDESGSLPPLNISRKRQHAHSASAGPKFAHGRPLSTIASESETDSRMHIRTRPSHGSVDLLRSGSQHHLRHRRSKTLGSSSHYSNSSGSNYETVASDESQADVTQFSLMRSQSAVPTPLFSSSPRVPAHEPSSENPSNHTDGEQDDTIAELQAPTLRGKHSAHQLNRRRSISDPPPGTANSNQTSAETDRTSQASSIFPQWAKQFYRGSRQLGSANASRVSLSRSDSQAFSTRSPVRMMPWMHHRRFESGWESYTSTNPSVFSDHPDTTRSNLSNFTHSPAGSSHFLPSIFRPYTRRRAYTDITAASKSQPSDDFYESTGSERSHSGLERGERDSLEITPAPLRPGEGHAVHHPSPLGSTPSRKLRNQHRQQRRREREARRQQQQQNLPRDNTFGSSQRYPSTTLSATQFYGTPPHLMPSRRLSHRISTWRAPSFDEALNTLILSRGNRQILFFCLGFICPVLWIAAAFLPIPPRPIGAQMAQIGEDEETKSEMPRYTLDLQLNMGMFDWEQEKRYLKARWWRNLNRVMSFVGVGVIVAIIVLAVVASK